MDKFICTDVTEIVTRKDARSRGLKRYFTGAPCPHGHIDERFTSGGGCRSCIREHLERARRAKGIEPRSVMPRDVFLGKRRALNQSWKERNREELARKSREYYSDNKTLCDARNKARYHENPAPYIERARKYRARRRGAEGSFTQDDVNDLFRLQKGRCCGCRARLLDGYHVDHIVALSRGGSNGRSNIQLLCAPCNHSKHALDPIDWAQRNGRLL